jgi:hypothetical protein
MQWVGLQRDGARQLPCQSSRLAYKRHGKAPRFLP